MSMMNDMVVEPLHKQLDEMLSILHEYLLLSDWCNPSSYEELAADFQRTTGITAPGKDQAPGMDDGFSYEGRYEAWQDYIALRKRRAGEHADRLLEKRNPKSES